MRKLKWDRKLISKKPGGQGELKRVVPYLNRRVWLREKQRPGQGKDSEEGEGVQILAWGTSQSLAGFVCNWLCYRDESAREEDRRQESKPSVTAMQVCLKGWPLHILRHAFSTFGVRCRPMSLHSWIDTKSVTAPYDWGASVSRARTSHPTSGFLPHLDSL